MIQLTWSPARNQFTIGSNQVFMLMGFEILEDGLRIAIVIHGSTATAGRSLYLSATAAFK